MSTSTPIGRQREQELSACLVELRKLADEFEAELVNINDRYLRPQADALVLATKQVASRHSSELKPTVADDLAGLMNGAIAFRMPSSDPDLGPTSTLERLRKYKGLLVAGLTDALEAARGIGLRPQESELHHEFGADLPRGEVDHLLRAIAKRLADVERTLMGLEVIKTLPTKFSQQSDLLNFYTESMSLEIDIAKLHLDVGTEHINAAGLARTVEVMTQLTRDFLSTVREWTGRLSVEVIDAAGTVRKRVSRLAAGVRATISWVVRKRVRRAVRDQERDHGLEHRLETSDQTETPKLPKAEELAAQISGGHGPSAQAVVQYLPFLRRYARALAGNQASGDAYVSATIERFVEDPKLLVTSKSTRVAMYKLFCQIYNSLSRYPSHPDRSGSAEILPISDPLVREAFLLVCLEGFRETETAEILQVDEAEVRRLIEQAGRDVASNGAARILIIEPNPNVATHLTTLIEALGHQILGVARTHSEAVRLARHANPDAVLAEIQLADGSSGLDAVNEILGFVEVPVIFITEYPERFLVGARPEPAFLIAKPYESAMVSAILTQALLFKRNARNKVGES